MQTMQDINMKLKFISDMKKCLTVAKQHTFNQISTKFPMYFNTRHKLVSAYTLHIQQPESKQYKSSKEKLITFLDKKMITLLADKKNKKNKEKNPMRIHKGGFAVEEDNARENALFTAGTALWNIVDKQIIALTHFEHIDLYHVRRALETHIDSYSRFTFSNKPSALCELEKRHLLLPVQPVNILCLIEAAKKYGVYGITNMKSGDKLYRAMCFTGASKSNIDVFISNIKQGELDRITSFSPQKFVEELHGCNEKKDIQVLITLILGDNPNAEIFSDSTIYHEKGIYFGDVGFEVQVMNGKHNMTYTITNL